MPELQNKIYCPDRTKKPPDLISMGLIELDYPIDPCPRCNHLLKGPYTRYHKRENDLFFDLTKKYYECIHCGEELSVLDIQVLIETVSAKLPPAEARMFSMKMMEKYRIDPKSIKEIVPIFVDDFDLSKENPFDKCTHGLARARRGRNVDGV